MLRKILNWIMFLFFLWVAGAVGFVYLMTELGKIA
jgi:hypothetical protein